MFIHYLVVLNGMYAMVQNKMLILYMVSENVLNFVGCKVFWDVSACLTFLFAVTLGAECLS